MIELKPLKPDDREQFIKDNQESFNYGALEEFGMRDDHFEEDEQIISRETIEKAIDSGEAYRIMDDGKSVGGVIIKVARTCDGRLPSDGQALRHAFLRQMGGSRRRKGEDRS